jgi:hypothetical protein
MCDVGCLAWLRAAQRPSSDDQLDHVIFKISFSSVLKAIPFRKIFAIQDGHAGHQENLRINAEISQPGN